MLLALGALQLASDGILASAAAPYALPRAVPPAYGIRIYGALDWLAPAPYVESTLAEASLSRGDVDGAERYALRLPPIAARNELLAKIAHARGQRQLALEYYLVAPDVNVVQREILERSQTDPAGAYALELTLRDRLEMLFTHPDAVAEAYWMLGRLADKRALAEPRRRDDLMRLALRHFQTAIELAPFSEKYLLAAGNQALALGDLTEARRQFSRDTDINPNSAIAYAGLGLVALRSGDNTSARTFAQRARLLDANAPLLRTLEQALK